MRWRLVALLVLAACSTSAPHDAAPPPVVVADAAVPDAAPPDAPVVDAAVIVVDAPTPPLRTDCKADATAERECLARKGYDYGPEPYIPCTGVQQPLGDPERARARARTRACTCTNHREIEQRRIHCAQVP